MDERSTRAKLVSQAREVIERDGYSRFSLRSVVKAAGLSPGAPYRHFEHGVPEILGAVAATGFDDLIVALERTRRYANPRERILEVGLTYVQFGVESPDLYRTMFSPQMAEPLELHEELFQEGKLSFSSRQLFETLYAKKMEAFGLITEPLRQGQERGLLKGGDPETFALVFAALLYGLVSEFIDEGLGFKASLGTPWSKDRREMSVQMIELLLTGLEIPRTAES